MSVHETVREHYGKIAESQGASCCGTKEVTLYEQSLLDGLPVGVTNLSLGCGDPVTIANLKTGETVLDLGSGGGIDCFMAARQVGPAGHVIGVDMTPAMLEKANAAKARMGVENVDFRFGQIESLPVDANSVDVIMSNCVINLTPDKAPVFHEAFRVLKPGGRVSISDIVTEGEFSDEMRADAGQWAACVSGAIDVGLYTGLMREAGFVDIEVVSKDNTKAVAQGMPRIYSARITACKPV